MLLVVARGRVPQLQTMQQQGQKLRLEGAGRCQERQLAQRARQAPMLLLQQVVVCISSRCQHQRMMSNGAAMRTGRWRMRRRRAGRRKRRRRKKQRRQSRRMRLQGMLMQRAGMMTVQMMGRTWQQTI
jgi:hypothetical protein